MDGGWAARSFFPRGGGAAADEEGDSQRGEGGDGAEKAQAAEQAGQGEGGADGGAVSDALPAGLAEDAFHLGGGGLAQVVDLVVTLIAIAGLGVSLEFVPLLWAGVLDFGEAGHGEISA